MRIKRFVPILLILALAACTHAPPNLSPEASQAFVKTRVMKGLDLLRDTAIIANEQSPPLLREATTRRVVLYHRSALTIIKATDAGWQKAVAASLLELNANLTPEERSVLGPYMGLIQTLLQEVLS